MVPEDRPAPPGRGLEIDLNDLAGGVAAHHHVEKRLPGRRDEPGAVVEERNIAAAGVGGVGMRDPIRAAREQLVHGVREKVQDDTDPEEIRPGALRRRRGCPLAGRRPVVTRVQCDNSPPAP